MGAFLSVLLVGAVLLSMSRPSYEPPTIRYAGKTALLRVKKRKSPESKDEGVEHISLQTLLESRCPSLYTEFEPLWWLFNGHMQTIYSVFADFSKRDRMSYLRKYIRVADGGTLGLDYAPLDQSSVRDDAPIVVVQHGLTGGSYEAYVRAVLVRACAPVEKGGLGYRAVVINFRGCAGVPITSQQLYSCGGTGDIRNALAFISHQFPKARLLGLGFSLGSNIMTNYLGEEGSKSRLHSACALACPWNLGHNNDVLLKSFVGRHVYAKGMGGNLQNLVRKHLPSLTVDPNHPVAKVANEVLLLKNPTLHEFDDVFACVGGGGPPDFPFRSYVEYYLWGASDKMVPQIAVPFLAVNSADDPVVRRVPVANLDNGLVAIRVTKEGGHLGWFQGDDGFSDRWTTRPILEWLKLMGEDLVSEGDSKAANLFIDEEGWLREEGRPHLGSKELFGKGHVFDGNGGEGDVLQGF